MTIRHKKTDEICVGFLSYEFPPKIYGGVGVHVTELTRHLADDLSQVHVFTSYVDGLNDQKAGNVFVHRSSKPVIPASHYPYKTFEEILTNFSVPGIVEKNLSNNKPYLIHSLKGLIRAGITKTRDESHMVSVITAQSPDIDRFKSDRPDIIRGQTVVDYLDWFNPNTIFKQKDFDQTSAIVPRLEGLDGQKSRSVYGATSSQPLIPVSYNSNKCFERVMDNLNVAGLVEKHNLNAELDLLHSHGGLIQLAATEAKNDTGLPLVMTVHSTEINRLRPDWLSVIMEHNVVDKVDRFIAVSEYMQRELNQTFGVNYNNITVIPNGVDTGVFMPKNADDLCRKYKLDDKFIVLFVGRDDPQKGVKYLVNAVKNLVSQIPEIMLVMVGQQDIYNDKHILCLQHVKKRELIKLYSLSDVFVLPSIYEPFGIVLLEAMACETPCIGIHNTGMNDIIDHNSTGLLTDAGSSDGLSKALAALYHDPEKRYMMGKKGREKVISYFSWKDISKKTIEVYRHVLNSV